MRYVDALLDSMGRAPIKRLDPSEHEEKVAQEAYRYHLAVEREERTQLRRLECERDGWARHDDEAERYYTALGVLLEEKVRGLIREWRGGLVR